MSMPPPPAGTSLTPPPPTMTAPSNPPPPFAAGPALGRRFCDSDPAVVGDTRPGVAPEVAPGGGTAPPGRDGVTLGTTAPRPASPVGGATGGRTSGANSGHRDGHSRRIGGIHGLAQAHDGQAQPAEPLISHHGRRRSRSSPEAAARRALLSSFGHLRGAKDHTNPTPKARAALQPRRQRRAVTR